MTDYLPAIALALCAGICMRGAYNSMAERASEAQKNVGSMLMLLGIFILIFLGGALGQLIEPANA